MPNETIIPKAYYEGTQELVFGFAPRKPSHTALTKYQRADPLS